jgi:hypothetical protein
MTEDTKVHHPVREERDDGGPAFPRPGSNWIDHRGRELSNGSSLGLSVRDWFAGMAMQGLLIDGPLPAPDRVASVAYTMADAMLRARTRGAA